MDLGFVKEWNWIDCMDWHRIAQRRDYRKMVSLVRAIRELD